MLFWFQCLLGNFITRSVWWTDHLSRDYDIRAQAFWCIVLYTYQRHYGLRGTSLWSTVLHFTGQAPHTQPWEHLWGKRRISFTLSFIPTSIFMAHFACSGGCYGPAELDPGILCSLLFFSFYRIVAFFSPLHDTRCKWALGGSESVALNVDFCGTSGSLSHKLMKQIYDGCWAQQIKLTVMYGGLMPPWSLHSTTGRSLPGYTLVRIC